MRPNRPFTASVVSMADANGSGIRSSRRGAEPERSGAGRRIDHLQRERPVASRAEGRRRRSPPHRARARRSRRDGGFVEPRSPSVSPLRGRAAAPTLPVAGRSIRRGGPRRAPASSETCTTSAPLRSSPPPSRRSIRVSSDRPRVGTRERERRRQARPRRRGGRFRRPRSAWRRPGHRPRCRRDRARRRPRAHDGVPPPAVNHARCADADAPSSGRQLLRALAGRGVERSSPRIPSSSSRPARSSGLRPITAAKHAEVVVADREDVTRRTLALLLDRLDVTGDQRRVLVVVQLLEPNEVDGHAFARSAAARRAPTGRGIAGPGGQQLVGGHVVELGEAQEPRQRDAPAPRARRRRARKP